MAFILYILGMLVSIILYFKSHAQYEHALREGCDHHAITYLNAKLHFAITTIICLIYSIRDELKTT